jgi:hypothetical protein
VPSIGDVYVDPLASPRVGLKASEPAKVRVEFDRLGDGAPALGAVEKRVRRGTNTLRVKGGLAKRLAGRGRYRATVTARDAAGRRAKARRVTFRR